MRFSSPLLFIMQEEGGQLTEAVRRSPHCVVLLDEIEKAHGDVLNILLQIMEDGILTDGKGRTVSFKNVILVMTSNVGSKRILDVSREDISLDNETETPIKVTRDISLEAARKAIDSSKKSSSPEPLRPEQVLQRMQNSPEAAKLMMEASQDPVIMKAMRTAMDGSPAELLEAGKQNPTVANFLGRLWAVLEEDGPMTKSETFEASEKKVDPPKANGTKKPEAEANGKSALDAIRDAVQSTTSGWDNPAKTEFSTGLLEQLEDMGGKGDETTAEMMTADERNNILYPRYMEVVTEALEETMKPELLNRIDEIVVFSPLSQNDLSNIAELIMQKTVDRAEKEKEGMELLVQPGLVEKVVQEGSAFAAQFGARPMRRAAQRFLEDPVSDAIVQGFLDESDIAEIDLVHETGNDGFGLDTIRITRRRDGKTLDVIIEEGTGGIGQASTSARGGGKSRKRMASQPELDTEAVRG